MHHFPAYRTLNLSPLRDYLDSAIAYLQLRSTYCPDEQTSKRPSKPHSFTASAAPAASSKSPYRKCPGINMFDSTRSLAAWALVDTVLRFNDN